MYRKMTPLQESMLNFDFYNHSQLFQNPVSSNKIRINSRLPNLS